MKKIFFAIVFASVNSYAFTQVMPESFIKLLPGIPGNACSMKLAERDKYLRKVDSLSELISTEISRRHEKESKVEPDNKQAMNNIQQQYGLSEEDMKKLKSDTGLSDAESQALANKILQNSANISMDEANSVAKMNTEGQNAWAEGYSAEVMADQKANPQKYKDKQLNNKNAVELASMQRHLSDSLGSVESKFAEQFRQLENDTSGKLMLQHISKWKSEGLALMGVDNGQDSKAESLASNIKAEKKAYCNKFTPRYLDILKKYEAYTKSCIPVCYKLEKISAQLAKVQTGIELNTPPGTLGISKVGEYVNKLKYVFGYNLLDTTDEE